MLSESTPLSGGSGGRGVGGGGRPAPLSPAYHKWRQRLQILLLAAIVGLIIWAALDYAVGPRIIQHGLKRFLGWVGAHPYTGAAAFLFVYAGCTLLFIPGALLTLGGAFLFGHALGPGRGFAFAFVAVYAGACLGAVAAFLLGRFLLHADAQRLLHRYPAMLAIDRALRPHPHAHAYGGGESEEEEAEVEGVDGRRTPLKVMCLLRLSPLVPFAPLNYLMSVTSLSLRDYTLGLLGMIPATLAYVFLGTTAGSLASSTQQDDSDGSGAGARFAVRVALYVLGALSLVAAVALLSLQARRRLRRLTTAAEAEEAEAEAEAKGDEEEGEGGRRQKRAAERA